MQIEKIAIIGAGVMGTGISQAFANAGFKTHLWGLTDEELELSLRNIRENLDMLVKEGFINSDETDSVIIKITPTSSLKEAVEGSSFIIETVVEDALTKGKVYSEVEKFTNNVIIATTTSGLSITKLADMTRMPDKFIGTHFWNPAYLMPLVEIIPGNGTSNETVKFTEKILRSIGKYTVTLNKDVLGFIGNRMLYALWREAISMIENGIAEPEDIDTVVKLTFGLRSPAIGPLENMDLVGLDLILSIMEYLLPDLESSGKPSRNLRELVERKELGMKTKKGFYDWTEKDAGLVRKDRDSEIIRQLKRRKNEMVTPVGCI